MQKTDRIARELEQSVSTGVENAKDWAGPRVEAAVIWAVPRLEQGLDSASPKVQEGLKSAAYNLADGVATVTPRIQDGLAQLAPKIHDAVEGATPRLHDALDKATPVIANARDRVVVDYLPKLSDQMEKPPTPCTAPWKVHRPIDAVAQRLVDSGVVPTLQGQAQCAGEPDQGRRHRGEQGRQRRACQAAEAQAPRPPDLRHHRGSGCRRRCRLEGLQADGGTRGRSHAGNSWSPVPATTTASQGLRQARAEKGGLRNG